MENIYEIIGETITYSTGDQYYALDCKKFGEKYFCYGININSPSLDTGGVILELSLKDGKLSGFIYNGDDYQSILDTFLEPDNLRKCLDFMNIQRDVLAKENREA